MKNEFSNEEVDRILQEVQMKKAAQAVSNHLVDEVLQSIQRAETPSAQEKENVQPTKPQPQLGVTVKKVKPAVLQQPKPEPEMPTDGTQEFQFNLHLQEQQQPQSGKSVVVDDRFRDFFTQTALEIPPVEQGQKKEKKPSLRERLNQAKKQNEQPQKPQYQESAADEDAGFALEEQKEQRERQTEQTKQIDISPEPQPQYEEYTGEFSFEPEQSVWEEEIAETEVFDEPLNEEFLPPQQNDEPTEQEEPAQDEPTIETEPILEQQSEEPEEPPKKKKGFFGGLRLFGQEENKEETEQQEQPTAEFDCSDTESETQPEEQEEESTEETEEIEYNHPEEAQQVQADLRAAAAKQTLKGVVSGLLGLLLLWLSMGAARLYPLPEFISPAVETMPFLIVNIVLTAAAAVVCFSTVKNGILGLVTKPSSDTMPALAILGAIVQAVVLAVYSKSFEPVTFTLFSGIAVLCLSLNAFGKRLYYTVTAKNFEMASSQLEHWAATALTDRERVSAVARGLDEPQPHLVVSRPTALVKDFLKQSFSERKSEKTAQKLARLLLLIALLCAVVGGLRSKNLSVSASLFAATLCIGAPFASTLLAAVPALLMQKQTARVGAVVPGWSAVEELGKTNMVLVGAKDLFPAGTVALKGIKTFEKERIDLAILYAASILVEQCDTMKEVFSEIVQGKTDILYPVESFTLEVGCGYSAWINNERVLIGTREMMQRHGLTPPSEEWEGRCSKDGERQLLYLAVSGKLFGVFGLEYHIDRSVQKVINSLHRRGISLLVKSDDCCITESLIAQIYGIPPESVKVLNEQERKALGPELIYRTQSEGVMTHLGSFASFVGGLRAAETAAAGENLASMVQTAAVVFGCLLALVLTVSGGLISLALPAVVLYQAAWTVLQLAVPLIKQYE